MTARPERTCIGCRRIDAKTALLRIRRIDGRVEADFAGTGGGRGAYVHRALACIEAATKKGAPAKALRTSIGSDELGRLRLALSQGAP